MKNLSWGKWWHRICLISGKKVSLLPNLLCRTKVLHPRNLQLFCHSKWLLIFAILVQLCCCTPLEKSQRQTLPSTGTAMTCLVVVKCGCIVKWMASFGLYFLCGSSSLTAAIHAQPFGQKLKAPCSWIPNKFCAL